MADWKAIKTEYITTDTSYRKLADKYGVSYAVIGKRASKEGWTNDREQWINKTTTKTLDAISNTQVSTAERLHSVTEKILNKIEAIVESVDPQDIPAKSIQALTTALKNIKEIQGIRSHLDDEEQEARIAKLRKEAESDASEDREVNVIFDGDIEQYSK